MSKTCSICAHPRRNQIDQRLVAGADCPEVARGIGGRISVHALRRHRAGHLSPKLALAHLAEQVATADDLLEHARALQQHTIRVLEEAAEGSDTRAFLAAIRESRSNLEFLARLLGQIEVAPQINVLELPEWLRVRDALLEALRPYPEARYAAAARLAALDTPAAPAPSDPSAIG